MSSPTLQGENTSENKSIDKEIRMIDRQAPVLWKRSHNFMILTTDYINYNAITNPIHAILASALRIIDEKTLTDVKYMIM
jgi:hypothetical protein